MTENQFLSYEDQLSFTEKIWKPITNLQPFILMADRHQIKKLKQIEILCNKSLEEIHDWYWSIEKILMHNYYHFYGKWIKSQRDKLLGNLQWK